MAVTQGVLDHPDVLYWMGHLNARTVFEARLVEEEDCIYLFIGDERFARFLTDATKEDLVGKIIQVICEIANEG